MMLSNPLVHVWRKKTRANPSHAEQITIAFLRRHRAGVGVGLEDPFESDSLGWIDRESVRTSVRIGPVIAVCWSTSHVHSRSLRGQTRVSSSPRTSNSDGPLFEAIAARTCSATSSDVITR